MHNQDIGHKQDYNPSPIPSPTTNPNQVHFLLGHNQDLDETRPEAGGRGDNETALAPDVTRSNNSHTAGLTTATLTTAVRARARVRVRVR